MPSISEAEWEVMKVLWEQSPLSANEIIEELKSVMDWSPKTVRTLLTRLVKKGVISFHQEKVYTYYPLLSKDECVKDQTQSFVQRIYGVAFKPLFVNFLKHEKLSKEDIAELKRILDEKPEVDEEGK